MGFLPPTRLIVVDAAATSPCRADQYHVSAVRIEQHSPVGISQPVTEETTATSVIIIILEVALILAGLNRVN